MSATFGADFLDWCTTIVTIRPRTGTTGDGTPSYGTLRYYHAYVNGTGELFRDAQGQQVVSAATLYLYPLECNADGTPKPGALSLTALPETSEVTWPDPSVEGGTARPVILKVNALKDENGLQMWQLHT